MDNTETKSSGSMLKDHIIVCGFNPTTVHIISELERFLTQDRDGKSTGTVVIGREYIVIDEDLSRLENAKAKFPNMQFVAGDATEDDVLVEAGVETAFGIFPVLDSDRDNVFITFTARQLNEKIRIISGTSDLFNIGKRLTSAGANGVVSANFIGGLRLVSDLARPDVTAFLDIMLRGKDADLQIVEIPVADGATLCNKSLQELKLPEEVGLLVIALLKKEETNYIYNPPCQTIIHAGDLIVVMGSTMQIGEITKLATK